MSEEQKRSRDTNHGGTRGPAAAPAASPRTQASRLADLERRNQELSLLNRLAIAAGGADDLQTLLERTSDEVLAALGARSLAVLLLGPESDEATVAFTRGCTDPSVIVGGRVAATSPALAEVLQTGRALGWDTTDSTPAIRVLFEQQGYGAMASAPLRARAETLGAVFIGFPQGTRLEPAQIALLEAMASHIAAKVEADRLLANLRTHLDELQHFSELGRALVNTLELQPLLDDGARHLARIVDASDAYVLLQDRETPGTLIIRATHGDHPELLGVTVPADRPDASLAGWSFHTLQPAIVEDGVRDRRVNKALRARSRGRSYLAVPLGLRDHAIGAVLVAETRSRRRFTAAEVERVTAMANQLAVAVDHARLYADLRRSYADLAAAQEQLVQRERLAALGELAAVMAHEVRNPLGVLFNSLGALRRMLPGDGQVGTLLHIMTEESTRLNSIVNELLDFARPVTPAVTPVALPFVLDDAVGAALASGEGAAVQIVREIDPGLPPVPLDARLLRQALLNVLLNALQAMPDGGTLTLRARVEDEGRHAVIEIADTGGGVANEAMGRIFEPFFTTRARGSGLGLVVVKRIMEAHRGSVSVQSDPGRGTCFTLRLPTG